MGHNNHSETLFHYTGITDGLGTLIKILQSGFKFSYCEEFLPRNRFVAFPMVCFCDIPLDTSEEHRSKFGKYGIGISKQYLIDKYNDCFGPINYVLSHSHIDAAFIVRDMIEEERSRMNNILKNGRREEADSNSPRGRKPQISLTTADGIDYLQLSSNSKKHHIQFISAIALMKAYESNGIINYDECEWRLFIPEYGRPKLNTMASKCNWYWNVDEYRKAKGDKKPFFYEGGSLKVPISALDTIVIPSDADRSSVEQEILNLPQFFGEPVSDELKLILMERIVCI